MLSTHIGPYWKEEEKVPLLLRCAAVVLGVSFALLAGMALAILTQVR